jgi:hypothetical protein
VAAVDLDQNTAYALHAKQTIPLPTTVSTAVCKDLQHLQETKPFWPVGVRYLVVDGAYTRYPFIKGVRVLGLDVVGKLRRDANLRYLFTGKQKPRGRPKLYDGKVRWKEFEPTRWHEEGELEAGVHLYSALLYHVSLKRTLKVVLLLHTSAKTLRQVLLFSTDLQLDARKIVRFYQARFQIEFLFRDAKGGAGLTHCQGRSTLALHFHWNAAFAALNLAKIQNLLSLLPTNSPVASRTRFSWASSHQKHANEHFLRFFSHKLDLDWSSIKSHPNFLDLCNYGAIAP